MLVLKNNEKSNSAQGNKTLHLHPPNPAGLTTTGLLLVYKTSGDKSAYGTVCDDDFDTKAGQLRIFKLYRQYQIFTDF